MIDRAPEPLSAYEAKLGRDLRLAADRALRPFDAHDVARAAVVGRWRRGFSWHLPMSRPAAALIALALALAALGGALLAGGLVSEPAPARNGHLVYELDGDIWVADWDGANAVRIADGTPDRPYHDPQWSNDGGTLSLFRYTSEASPEIFYQADRDGRGLREVGRGRGSIVSPSGALRFATAGSVLTVVDRAGGSIDLPVPAGFLNWHHVDPPSWTPDSSRIIAAACTTSDCKGDMDLALFSVPVSGAAPTRLTPAGVNELSGSVSPDGTMLAFTAFEGHFFRQEDGTWGVGLVGLDGTGRRFIPGLQSVNAIPWSPDGRTVAVTGREDAVPGIWILSMDPTVPPRLLPDTEDFLFVHRYSPDGRWLLAVSARDRGGLWLVEVDGDSRRELVPAGYAGDWQPLPIGD